MKYALAILLAAVLQASAVAQTFVVTERWTSRPAAGKRVARVTMRWNVSGNWSPTEIQTRQHLEREHGVQTSGMTHQQMLDLHDSLHDGRRVVRQSLRVQSSCPGGVCPAPGVRVQSRSVFRWKR